MESPAELAQRFSELYAQAFLLFYRRRERNAPAPSQQGHLLLMHLSHSGPLTIGQLALHLDRAQSVVSEAVEALEEHGWLARVQDPRDRRRTLVWLTDSGIELLSDERQVLDLRRVGRALAALPAAQAAQLLGHFAALLDCADRLRHQNEEKEP